MHNSEKKNEEIKLISKLFLFTFKFTGNEELLNVLLVSFLVLREDALKS